MGTVPMNRGARRGRGFRLALLGPLSALVVFSAGCGTASPSASAATTSATKAPVASATRTAVAGASPKAFTSLKSSSVNLFDGSGAFAEVRFTVTPAKKRAGGLKGVFEGCALLARNAAEHAQGMMQRSNFAGYDAMIFHFEQPSNGAFWMKTVPMDLSIAWVDGLGKVVYTAEMKGEGDCTNCVIYDPKSIYRTAVEAPPKGLARLGLDQVSDGSVLAYGGPCKKSPGR